MKEALFKVHDKIILRTPLYPYNTLFSPHNTTKHLDEIIKEFLRNDIFLEGIYWSSPQLYQNVIACKSGHYNNAKKAKLLQTLKKYAIRACMRCTPYGIFAGCNITGINKQPINNNESLLRKTRIDMELLLCIKKAIECDDEVWRHLQYKINDTLYSLPGQYRFIEPIDENGKYNYQVSSIEQTEMLQNIVELGKTNTFSFNNIGDLLKEEHSSEEIKEFFKSLVDASFLISELQPSLTVEDEPGRLKTILKRIKHHTQNAEKYINLLSAIEYIIQKLAIAPLGQISIVEIEQIRDLLNECGVSGIPEHLFQTDLLKPAPEGFVFSNQNINKVEEAIKILSRLSPAISPHEAMLNKFRQIFSEKYERTEVSLSEVLDPESGIGFAPAESIGNAAHNSFIGSMNISSRENTDITLNSEQLWLLNKMETSNISQWQQGIELTERDLEGFDSKIDELPDHISVMGTLLPSGKIFLQSAGGPNAIALSGRFAYMNDDFEKFCKTLSNEEKNNHEDTVYAEIVHIPEGRTGNIARRVKLYDYEIPILTTSSSNEQTIYLNDLVVSVVKNEIILRSVSLNKRVIPRLNNAHNYNKSVIPAYRFLAAVQHQHKPGFNISWGALANKKRFLPRISYKNIILHRATWRLQPDDIEIIKKNGQPLTALKVFLKEWRIPQFICIAEADNELFIDTFNDSYNEILIEQIKKHSTLQLIEWLHDENYKGDIEQKTPYISQFILSLSKKNIAPVLPVMQPTAITNKIPRSFAPGSEWLYFKFYCGAFLSDTILSSVVKPAMQCLLEMGIIKKAFFIRYKDPHYHIRFRMLLCNPYDKNHFTVAISRVYELLHAFSENKTVWKIQIDTYEREIERYGANAIVRSEEAFYHDSLLLLNCLEEEEFRNDDEIRFLAGMKNTDKWLHLYKMDTTAKLQFCNKAAEGFSGEFGNQLRPQLNAKYSALKDIIFNFMQGGRFDEYFNKREKKLAGLHLPLENLSSYIHISQNRWFTTQQRLQEYMCFYFCSRYYNRLLHEKPQGKKLISQEDF